VAHDAPVCDWNSIRVAVDEIEVVTATDADPLPPGTIYISDDFQQASDFLVDDFSIAGEVSPVSK
jgi:hypothetical protein